jgi:hypothetical protein
MLRRKNRSIIVSYLTLRKLIGIMGMLLPLICVLGVILFSKPGVSTVYDSISYYYHTNMRDFFVGLLFVLSLFLVTYKGYELIDNIITIIIGIAGFGIAVFPCLVSKTSTIPVGIFQLNPKISNILHLISAAIFFILLGINSMCLFTLSDEEVIVNQMKIKRNIIYKVCGIIIFVSLAALAILYLAIGLDEMNQYRLVFIYETIMLLAFGTSWLVKGGTIYKDIM